MKTDLTEQSKFYEKFKDPRPLTEETLQELGFEHQEQSWEWVMKDIMNDKGLFAFADKNNNGEWIVGFDFPLDALLPIPKWKTVGSVKMLIEALKGDE